jgi:hypothetical protein
MSSTFSKKRLSIAFVAGVLVAGIVPGLTSASIGQCEDKIGPVVKFATATSDGPMGGPNSTFGWAHPDGKTANPGQAIQYFCFER